MARIATRTVALLAALAVLLCAGAALAANRIEHAATARAGDRTQSSQLLLTSLLTQEDGAAGYLTTGAMDLLDRSRDGATAFAAAVNRARRLDAGSASLQAQLTALGDDAHRWQAGIAAEVARRQAIGRPPTARQAAADRDGLSTVRARYLAYSARVSQVDHHAVTDAAWLAAGLVAAVALALACAAVALTRRAQLRERSRTARLAELRELLQVSDSEAESRQLLLRHLQRLLPDAGAAVLTRRESEDRLEPTFGERVATTPLTGLALGQLRSDACLAVRLGRAHERDPGSDATEPLVRCDTCGRLGGDVACEPLQVNGRTLGAVLVARDGALDADRRGQLRESVALAAPILAVQRSLELAERRAASDPLTNLPNRRAADEALTRLSAQAGRTVTPLAAVLVDLDHFKQVNDRHGHAQGDRALSEVARVLAAGVRASDFVARYGGEEFLVLAPDTDRRGAADLAEKLRDAIAHTTLPVIGPMTASIGVAALPEDAVDPGALLRRADRALYAAKALGRNRVQEAEPSVAPEG